MPVACPLLVFSDLDGTLVDHHSYDWRAAEPALKALGAMHAGVVLASSKTAPEIVVLRSEMGLEAWPAIVENGAGLLPAHQDAATDDAAYVRLRSALDDLPQELSAPFRGFGDMTSDDVAGITGLSASAAQLAKKRSFSEPGLWSGSDDKKAGFLNALALQGISAQQGGRFLTLSFGRNKSDQMADLIAQFQPRHTIALGDAPNDIEMLQTAEFGVIIANPARAALPPLEGEAEGRIIRSTLAGPDGWRDTILTLTHRLNLR